MCARVGMAAALAWAMIATPAAAQWPPDSLVNLRVLPTDISVRELIGVMRGFADALGVRCIHCHVGEDSTDLSSVDFPSDDRVAKRKARAMLRMVRAINDTILAALPERSDPPIEVTCGTCHHGITRPQDIRGILARTARDHGGDSALAEYEALRTRYYGSASYDFRPFMLANVAQDLLRDAPDAALSIAEYNVTRYPDDEQNHITVAAAYLARADTAGAQAALQRGTERLPDSAVLRRLLQRLERGR